MSQNVTYSNKTRWECSGSVVECLPRDRGAVCLSLTGVSVASLSKNINPSLVLFQPRKTLHNRNIVDIIKSNIQVTKTPITLKKLTIEPRHVVSNNVAF